MPFQKGHKVNEKPISWTVNERSCWICTSHSKNTGGYPQKRVNGKLQKISRIFYEKYNGPIHQGFHVLHTCDTRACINPDHLFLGTHTDNMKDKVKKCRQAKGKEHGLKMSGEKHPMVKLTEAQVLEIRSMSGTQQEIADKYGISNQNVSAIKNYHRWKHLT